MSVVVTGKIDRSIVFHHSARRSTVRWKSMTFLFFLIFISPPICKIAPIRIMRIAQVLRSTYPLFSPIIGLVRYTNARSARRGRNSFRNQDVSALSLSFPLSPSTSIPHSPGGGQCLGGGHISSTLGGGCAGVEAKNLTEQKLSSVLGKAS